MTDILHIGDPFSPNTLVWIKDERLRSQFSATAKVLITTESKEGKLLYCEFQDTSDPIRAWLFADAVLIVNHNINAQIGHRPQSVSIEALKP